MSKEEHAENQFPELTAFESALAALRPRADEPDRETLFFQAGQAAALRELSGKRPSALARWAWPAAFSAMSAVAATLLAMLCLRGEQSPILPSAGTPQAIATIPVVPDMLPERESQPADEPMGAASYSRLRDEIVLNGIDGISREKVASSEPVVVAAGPLSYRELLNKILQEK